MFKPYASPVADADLLHLIMRLFFNRDYSVEQRSPTSYGGGRGGGGADAVCTLHKIHVLSTLRFLLTQAYAAALPEQKRPMMSGWPTWAGQVGCLEEINTDMQQQQ